jgi:thioredoxin-like negative regulator of GroEL
MVKRLNDWRFEETLDREKGVVGVAFMSYTSIPCDHFMPELHGLAEIMDGRIKFFIVDCVENPTLTDDLAIEAAPTLVMFKANEEIGRYEGPYSKEALKDRLETLLLFKKPDQKP